MPSVVANGSIPIPLRAALADIDHDEIIDLAVLSQFTGGVDLPSPIQYHDFPAIIQEPPTHVIFVYSCSVLDEEDGLGWQELDVRYRDANWALENTLYFPGWVNDVALADIDNDGDIDLVGVAEQRTRQGVSHLFYYPGLGDFTFCAPVTFDLSGRPLQLAVEDFDGDAFLDCAALIPMLETVELLLSDSGSGQGNQGATLTMLSE